jgi:hypothetical protein
LLSSALQISAATSAKQEQLRAIQQSMLAAAAANGSSKNKNKPVSTVEPFQVPILWSFVFAEMFLDKISIWGNLMPTIFGDFL